MYKVILITFSLLIPIFFTACGSDDSQPILTSCGGIVMDENNCYLDYVKLDDEGKKCCDTWIENNK